MAQDNSSTEFNQKGYVIDAENAAEMARLLDQEKSLTAAMNGVLAEQDNDDLHTVTDVLDIACGPGGWVFDIAHSYPTMQVTGIDISKRMIAYASSHAKVRHLSNVHFQVMDATQPLLFEDASFDLINSRLLVGFMKTDKWLPLLAECQRILRPGGILRMTECEWGYSNSFAFETLTGAINYGMYRNGNSFSPTGRHLEVATVLPHFFQQATFQNVQMQPYVVNASAGAAGYQAWFEDFKSLFQQAKPLMLGHKAITEESFEPLYNQFLEEAQKPDFCEFLYFLTIWGTKEGKRG